MKKKLFTLMTLLLCLCSTAWGQYVYDADTSVPEWTVNFNSWYGESDAATKTATTVHNPRLFWDTSGSTAKWNNHSVSTDIAFDADGFYYIYNPGTARQLPSDPTELSALCYVVYKANSSSTDNYPKYNNSSTTISAPSTTLYGLSNNKSSTSDAVLEIHAPRNGYVRMLLGTDANAEPSGGYSATLSGATTGTITINYLASGTTYDVKTKSGSAFTKTTYTSAGKKLKSMEFAVNAGTTTITMNPAAMCNNTSTARKLLIYAVEMYLASAGDAITLDANGGTKAGSGTIPTNATSFTPTAPEYAGHIVDGYYTTSDCEKMIATAAGALQPSIMVGETAWTDADSKWVKGGAATFYAHWKVNTPEISCTNNVVTISVPTGSTVYYTDDGTTTPTSESTPYTEPFAITATKTIKAIAIQSNCTNSEVATQECEFATPKYTITYNAGGGSGTMTATGNIEEGSSKAISANTFTRECYTFANWTADVDVTVGGATVNAGDPIADEATIQNITGDITLTAQWIIVYSTSADFNVYAYANLPREGSSSGSSTSNNFSYLTAKNISYNFSGNTALDHSKNANFIGLKMKNSTDYIKFAVESGKQVTVIFGRANADPKLYIDGTESTIDLETSSSTADNQVVYYASTSADRLFKIKSEGNTLVIKKIFIEDASTTSVTATVGANGYTTFTSPYALDLTDANRPEGLKAYAATLDGANLTFTELKQVVPAGTGLLLQGEAKGYNIPVVAAAGTAPSNALIGINEVTPMKSTADDNYFFVMKKASTASDALKFAPLTTGSTAVNVPAGKVVVEVPNDVFTSNNSRELTISFDNGGTTGINGLDNLTNSQLDNNAPMYNLAGQKVGKSYKGIVIVNGKKVVRK